jgi:hypothetical protein
MLGKLQFELQKLVDKYRSHIFQTITIPSESLLNELRIVEVCSNLPYLFTFANCQNGPSLLRINELPC